VMMREVEMRIGERKDTEVSLRPIEPMILDTESNSLALLHTTWSIEPQSANESSQ
jgi:hypothetical protein